MLADSLDGERFIFKETLLKSQCQCNAMISTKATAWQTIDIMSSQKSFINKKTVLTEKLHIAYFTKNIM